MRQFVIQIEDLRVHSRIGTTDEEQVLGQSLLVNLELVVNAPLRSDTLEETIDYGAIVQGVKEFAERIGKVKLVETFTSQLMDTLLDRFSQVSSITARVQKSYVPVKDFTGRISISMSTQRNSTKI